MDYSIGRQRTRTMILELGLLLATYYGSKLFSGPEEGRKAARPESDLPPTKQEVEAQQLRYLQGALVSTGCFAIPGAAPLARTERVTERIDPAIRQRFLERGVMYVRNYRANIDLPWQTVFQTHSREEVERFCDANGIQHEWTGADALRTRQVCHAFATHPRTGATVWFNQAHLFHPSSLDGRTRAAMREMFDEADFPRNAMYGDGGGIDESDLAHVRQAFEAETVEVGWRAGDVLIVDNMLASHGRTPYRGPRRVLVAMCNPYSAPMQNVSGSHSA